MAIYRPKPQLTKVSNYHHQKDLAKSNQATQMIGKGVKGSSTDIYRENWGDLANTGNYTFNDIVFVSINGKRRKRLDISHIKPLLMKAINAKVIFITDNEMNRERDYNIGEREVAELLKENGYIEIPLPCAATVEFGSGFWQPKEYDYTLEEVISL